MNKAFSLVTLFALAFGLATATAEAKPKLAKVKGHIIQVEQQVRTENSGTFDRLTIRTRQGEEMRLRLGSGDCSGCYRTGDQIRARVHVQTGPGGECAVHTMQLRRNGRIYEFHLEGEAMVLHRERGHHAGHHGRVSGSGRGGRGGSGG